MGFDIPFVDLPDLPANPEQYIRDRVIELLNYLGYPWPTTEPSALRAAGDQWNGLAGTVNGWISELEGAVSHLQGANSGTAMSTVSGYFAAGGDSNLAALRDLADAIPTISSGYGIAAGVADGLRLAVIAEILLDIISLALAIVSGGVAAGASFLIKQGAGAAIDYLIDQAISNIMGGA